MIDTETALHRTPDSPRPQSIWSPSWLRFYLQFRKDLRFYVYGVGLLFVFRLILIGFFFDRKSPDSGMLDILAVLGNGLRFDSRIAACFLIPSFLFGITAGFFRVDHVAEKIRFAIAVLFTLLTLILCGMTIPYFREYNDQFNQWMFGLIYDDRGAIVRTIWSEVPIVRMALGLAALAAMLVYLLSGRLNRPDAQGSNAGANRPAWKKALITISLVCFLAVAVRGSAGSRPVERKDAGITRDPFLNKTVMNPYDALRYLWQDYREINKGAGLRKFLPDEQIAAAANRYFGIPPSGEDAGGDLDARMRKTVRIANPDPPKHIFLIVMESYDAWPMLNAYASLQTSVMLKRLASRGIAIPRFLPGSFGTMNSLAVILTGLPDAGVVTNHQPSSLKPYSTSIAPIFRQLGYRTRFFYGGYLTWQRIEDFCRNQGFEEVYGGPDMGKWVHGNEWGVDDEALFAFVEKTISDDEPSFSVILSTSYHPPYDIDVYRKGYPVRTIPDDLKHLYDGKIELNVFGHLWYADRQLGEFVKRMERIFPATLFAITGDHGSRKFLNGAPSLFEIRAVPCVFYGPTVLKDRRLPEGVVGSHIDIAPTLVSLSAPEDFEYHSMGRDMLEPENAPREAFGSGYYAVTTDWIVNIFDSGEIHVFTGSPVMPDDLEETLIRAKDHYALGWQRIMRGPRL